MPERAKKNKKKEESKKPLENDTSKKASSFEEKKTAAASQIKYGYSINFSAGQKSASHEAKKEEAKEPTKEETQAPPKEEIKKEFAKAEEAVKEAETLDAKDIEHIKYSDKNNKKHKKEEAGHQPSAAAQPTGCGAAPCGGGSCANKESKPLFSFKEFYSKVKNITFNDVVAAISNTFTMKNAQAFAAGFLHWVDSCVSFITISKAEGRNEAMQKARLPILFGMWICIFTFLIGGIWSGFAPLNSATHASGIVVTTSKKQIIQYRDGGILKALYVKEGDHVKAGQILAQMDDATLVANVSNLRAQKASYEKETELAQESLRSIKTLAEQNYASRHQVIEAETRLADQQARVSQVANQLAEYEERLSRTTIKSPINGVITQLDVHTIGASIGSGQTLLIITPTEEELIIETFVQQKDIESVHVGLKAKIRIAAFKHRSVGALDGIVTYVSSDVLDVPQSRSPEGIMISVPMQHQMQAFYKAIISVDKDDLKKISKYKDYELAPGMQADITIVTGERTLIQYILDPILTTFWHAFSEK